MAFTRGRRLLWWVAGAVAVVVVIAVAAPYIYIHFIEGPAPARLALPTSHPSTTGSSSATTSGATSPSGTWRVGTGSLAGYRVQEVLVGQNSTAVGRTGRIWGSLTIDGSTVTGGSFAVDMASVVSDQIERNVRFDGSIMDVSQFPTAKFTLSSPIDLGQIPGEGVVTRYAATGVLDMHGESKTVSFPLSAERVSGEIDVLADIKVVLADWGIANPSVGGFVTTADNGTLEVLHLTPG